MKVVREAYLYEQDGREYDWKIVWFRRRSVVRRAFLKRLHEKRVRAVTAIQRQYRWSDFRRELMKKIDHRIRMKGIKAEAEVKARIEAETLMCEREEAERKQQEKEELDRVGRLQHEELERHVLNVSKEREKSDKSRNKRSSRESSASSRSISRRCAGKARRSSASSRSNWLAKLAFRLIWRCSKGRFSNRTHACSNKPRYHPLPPTSRRPSSKYCMRYVSCHRSRCRLRSTSGWTESSTKSLRVSA